MTEKKSMDKKYIFILTPGRSGSTLISHLLSNSLPKPTISQEGSGVCIKILHHYLTNNGNLPENIQDLIAQLEKNRHSNRQTSDPHYQYSYRPILYQDLIEAKDPQKLMSLLFNCDEQIVGSKNLCYLPYRSTEQLLMYLEIVDLLPNVYLVFHTRSPRDWFRSRRIKRFFLLGDESLSMLQEHIDLVNELVDGEQIFVTSHENVVNDCYNILTKLGVETTIERLNRLKKTRCSY